jgi:hypothetical protein
MSIPASALRITQFGVESTAGVPVAANKVFSLLSVSPGEERTGYDTVRQLGTLVPVDVTGGYRWFSGDLEGPISTTDMLYVLSAAFGQVTGTQVMDGSTGTGAYRYQWTISGNAVPNPKTLTLEVGQAGVTSVRAAGCQVTGLEVSITTSEATVSGTVLGRTLTVGTAMTGSPTRLARATLDPRFVYVRTATTVAGLNSATPLGRVREVSFSFGELVQAVPFLGADAVALVPTADDTEFSLTLAADAEGRARFAEYDEAQLVYVRVNAQGPVIYSSGSMTVRHALTLTVPVKWSEVSEFAGDDDGIWTFEFSGAIVEDGVLGGFAQVELVTTLATL